MNSMNRRRFLADSARIAGITAGALAINFSSPAVRSCLADEITFIETDCGASEKKNNRILVAYASACGSTGGVAEAIGKELCNKGADVDVRMVDNVPDTSEYTSVVVGSAIHSDKWLKEGVEFVKQHRSDLRQKPVAYFLTCLTLCYPSQENIHKARSFLKPVQESAPDIKPISMGLFAGALDYNKLSLIVRMVMKNKMKKKGIKEGDYRDFTAICAWARSIYDPLMVGRKRFGEQFPV